MPRDSDPIVFSTDGSHQQVCPTCHRRAHYAADSQEYNQRLIGIVSQKEPGTLT